MTSLLKNLEWKPSTVSWLSFVLMGLIVAGIGLSGTAHVVNYLQERLTAHGMEHNREVAEAIVPRILPDLEQAPPGRAQALAHAIGEYRSFGFRIVVIDPRNRALVADTEMALDSPLPLDRSWLAVATRSDGPEGVSPLQAGPARVIGENRHPVLIWLQEIATADSGDWLLGVAKDQKTLTEFMGDLHWHLDAILLLTYVLITLMGYYAMRMIGRIYERRLESQVSERTRELEAAHREMLLKARLATIGQTASALTHEMRNPLASIKLALSALKGADSLSERERRRVSLVLGEVDRLDAMLSETLDYVRPVKLSPQAVSLERLLSRVLEQQEPMLANKGLRINRRVLVEDADLRLDEAQMHEVLLNLLKNATEASPPGGEIGVSLGREDGDLVLEMRNPGEHLSPEALQRAFEPFFTTKSKGTGLGLGLVKRVVEEHGGSVVLSSSPEIGTQVTIHLPQRFS